MEAGGETLGTLNVMLAILAAVGVSGAGVVLWIYRDRLRDLRTLLTLAALLLTIPLGAQLIRERTDLLPKAEEEVSIVAVEVQQMEEGRSVVYVTLSHPAVAYMVYTPQETGEEKIVVGRGRVEKRTGHSFEVVGGGQAVFVVNGRTMEWGPVEIPHNW